LIRERDARYIYGLGPTFDNGHQIINFYYVDDTIFFLKANYKCMEVILLVLYAFESLSDIKINYSKTKLIPMGIIIEKTTLLVELICCKIFIFSLKYLGAPHFHFMILNWKLHTDKILLIKFSARYLIGMIYYSLKGEISVTQINPLNHPFYMLSLYKMSVKVRKRLDILRCQFLWQDISSEKRSTLVKWKLVCIPKQLDGTGILDL
jgi:hypothetical protein